MLWSLFATLVLLPVGLMAFDATANAGSAASAAILLQADPWRLLARSAAIAAGAATLALVLGLPPALLCERSDLPGRFWWRLLMVAPLLIPPFMHALVWDRLLAPGGALASWLGAALPLHTPAGVACVLALSWFPFVFLLGVSGLRGIDPRQEEAARLRVGEARLWIGLTLPLLRPHLLAGWLFVFVLSLMELATADILRVQTYPLEIFIQFSALYDESAAIALSLPLLALTLGTIGLLTWTMGARGYLSLTAGAPGHRRAALGHQGWPALALCAIPPGLAVLVPVTSLLVIAGPFSVYTGALRTSGTEILASTAIAAVAAILSVVLAGALVLSLHGLRSRVRVGLNYLVQAPFGLPPTLLGIGLILFWNRPQTQCIYGSLGILIIGYMALFLPFALRVLDAAFRQLSRSQVAAAVLAAGPCSALLLLASHLRNGLLAAGFIVFTLALGELGMTLLVTPPGLAPIPIGIYNLMHYGADDAVAAHCLMLVVIQLGVALVLLAAARRSA